MGSPSPLPAQPEKAPAILTRKMASAGCWTSVFYFCIGKARLAGRALVGGVRFSVSGWTKCPEVGQGAPHYSTFELFMVDTILLL